MPSTYLVFADETGTLDLRNRDPAYPVFGLTFVVIERACYGRIVGEWTDFRLRYLLDPTVPLRSYSIRRPSGPFGFLQHTGTRNAFLGELSDLMSRTPFTLISAVVRKDRLGRNYNRFHPYDIVLGLCLERLGALLGELDCGREVTPLLFESRGRREDEDLRGEFDAILRGDGSARISGLVASVDARLAFCRAGKDATSVGLQIADLCAYAIGRHVADPTKSYRSFEEIAPRIRGWPDRTASGLRVFPF